MTQEHPPQSFLDHLKSAPMMRPKWRFWLDHVLVGTAIVLVAIGLVYIGSFVTFLWRSSQFSALPAFGPTGYGVLARVFPWWHLGFILVGIVAFIYLIRRHTFLYRWPLAVTVGVFLLAFITAAFATDTTRVHDRLTNLSLDGGPLPFVGRLYRGPARLAQGIVTPGEITSVDDNELTMIVDGESLTVRITDRTILSPAWEPAVGEEIVVIGQRDGTTITADGIHQAGELPNRRPFRIQRNGPLPIPNSY